MKRVLIAALLVTAGSVYADAQAQTSGTNTSFLIETALLQQAVPIAESAQWKDRYRSFFETYDIPTETNLYYAYAEVLYQYARILKHEGQYEQAIQIIDKNKRVQLWGHVQHKLLSYRATILTTWAESEKDPKKTELLNEAERTIKSMQW